MKKYKQNELVVIHSLGPSYGDQEFVGKICGISVDHGDNPATIWIVWCPNLGRQLGFTHVTIPQACLKPWIPGQTWTTNG